MTSTYVAGELPTLVTSDGVVVAAADRIAEVAALVGRPLHASTVAEVLSRGGLTAVPDFAAVRRDGDEVHIAVRGAFAVRVDGFSVDGRDAATWAEATAGVGPGSAVEVVAAGAAPGGLALPLSEGVVRSAGVLWRPCAVSGQVTPSAPVLTPVPAPTPPARAEERTVVRSSAGPAATPSAPPTPPPPSMLPPSMPPPSAPPPSAPPPTPPAGPPSAPSLPPPPTPPAPPGPQPSAWRPGEDADHDGRTITPAQLQALRAGQVPPAAQAAPPARPRFALELSTGRVVPVRRRVLLGRNPRVQQVGGSANLPALVTVDDPYVSSTHLEVAADGSRVTVTDMSTNGTLLARRGGVPFPLEHGIATEIAPGDVLTLSKGLTATVVPAPAPER